MSTVDYIIVGQGLAGSALSWELLNRGKKIRVYDVPENNLSSHISAGICNPITGKAMTKTYLAEELFPFLNQWYASAEQLSGRKFFYPMPVYRPFISTEEQSQWKLKAAAAGLESFVERITDSSAEPGKLNDLYGGLWVRQSGYLHVNAWVSAVRERLIREGAYVAEPLEEQRLYVGDHISYNDVRASRLIFCNGMAALKSRYFNWLPLRPLKGEVLIVRASLQSDKIISRGVYLVPGSADGLFIVGSTYQHEPFTAGPTASGRQEILAKLTKVYAGPVETVHEGWGIRPTVIDRRPLLGQHPDHQNLIIFNGLGTKGVSLTPYFAKHLVDWMEGGTALRPEVNISRFKPLYSK